MRILSFEYKPVDFTSTINFDPLCLVDKFCAINNPILSEYISLPLSSITPTRSPSPSKPKPISVVQDMEVNHVYHVLLVNGKVMMEMLNVLIARLVSIAKREVMHLVIVYKMNVYVIMDYQQKGKIVPLMVQIFVLRVIMDLLWSSPL